MLHQILVAWAARDPVSLGVHGTGVIPRGTTRCSTRCDLRELLDRNMLVPDGATKHLPHDLCYLVIGMLDQTIEVINLPPVRLRLGKNASDHSSLVFARDWRVPPCSEGTVYGIALLEHRR